MTSGWRGRGRGRSRGESLSPTETTEMVAPSRTVRLGRVQPQAPGNRTVFCNDREGNSLAKFKGNSVSTTKYDIFTFLPKGLFEQIKRVANGYFLFISILSCTPVSPVSPVTNVVPLGLVLLVTLAKEAWEDWKRFQNDLSINNTEIEVLQGGMWVTTPWKKLQVGDIVKVKQDEFFPADLLFLASTNSDGVCYIETANLDGETNLKIRKALEKTWDYVAPDKVSEFKGEIQCEQPNNSLYTFTGNLILQKQTLPLSPNQILLRGCSLRNTEYIVGAVVFTGHETKVAALTMFTLITLYSPIIPISLYVSIEMIKFFQCNQFINNDLHMYHAESNTPALARTSNLNEELGQVEYIFSDKTGTLTRNLMEFFKCSIGGEIYGSGITEIEIGSAQRSGAKVEVQRSSDTVREKGFNFDDSRLMRGAWRNEPNPDMCKEFFRCLAICHTVLPEAKILASSFISELPQRYMSFNSTRKRQSVVCRYPDGRLVLYCKGADTVIYERLTDGDNQLKKTTRENLETFGSAGLRTLCLAFRDLSADEYENWNEKYIQSKSSLRDREKKLDEVAELIEKNLVLIGATAIEDKLQEGVPSCIETLSRAGIKIWVLTGDKMETAINIAYACKLINNSMKQFVMSSETDAIREVEEKGDQVEIARFMKETVKKELKRCHEEALEHLSSASGQKLALVIDGKCLMYALDPSLRVILLNLSLNCSAVVCCRVSPLQKAQVTSLVRKGAKRITLSIGDGANDVMTLQLLNFAFSPTCRWSYIRICKVVTYFFYKNLTFTLTQFWFTFQTGFSGQRFYDDWYQSLYNVIFTSFPVIIMGLFDKDVSASLSKKYPELYQEGIKNTFFKWRVVATWAFFAIYQSLVLHYFVMATSTKAMNSSGKIFGLWDISTMAFTCVVMTVNLRLLMMCNTITRWHYITVGGSILIWFIFVFIYSAIDWGRSQENIFLTIYVLMSTSYFYLSLLLVPVAALFVDFLYLGGQRWFVPYDYQVVQEIHRDEPEDRQILLEIGNQLTPDQARSYAIMQLPAQKSKHTGFAFDSPGYESFFAAQAGVYVPQKAWDVAKRASMKSRTKTNKQ
ncbi:hypothetical protein Leryth_020464 [Lithospermum erythrorhizon]|nr:hypothetical protein Leryth_020464 [Lithospermum erythrorhizon]